MRGLLAFAVEPQSLARGTQVTLGALAWPQEADSTEEILTRLKSVNWFKAEMEVFTSSELPNTKVLKRGRVVPL